MWELEGPLLEAQPAATWQNSSLQREPDQFRGMCCMDSSRKTIPAG
jgi:hypothetical protein